MNPRLRSGLIRVALLMLSIDVLAPLVRADDWTTTDGKKYKNVSVLKVEDDAVTILYSDGGALLPLATLPSDLQKRFHYDPARAKMAADKRAREDQAGTQAEIEERKNLDAEKAKEDAQTQEAQQIQDAKQEEERTRSELRKDAVLLTAEVSQVLPNGVLAEKKEVSAGQGAISYADDGVVIFVEMPTTGMAEGQQFRCLSAKNGTYQFTDTSGASRTVEKWITFDAPQAQTYPLIARPGDSLQSTGGG